MPIRSDSPIKLTGWYSGDNERLFKMMSIFLNLAADYVEPDMIEAITGGDKTQTEYAFASIAAAACGLDVYGNNADRRFFKNRFLGMFRLLDISEYKSNPYYRNIKLPEGDAAGGKWTFGKRICKPYEAFVYDDPDISVSPSGEVLVTPKIGFFDEAYEYHAVLENGREWMTLLPNETNTSAYAVERARGRVLTFGLGLGYYAYMASEKPEVSSVTVVERDKNAISLFREYVLPQFREKEKIEIICADAFEYAEKTMPNGNFDVVFTDIWHDPSDGAELMLKMKTLAEKAPGPEYIYWLENTVNLYL
ncbi:MAG: hypothetical protein MJ137_00805 [Clostridia bacterium]|nr:hypothetical protein [Clostridia bacterium]